jgi:tripartite-type tricarboxylate transporter receptor subunit TctC
MQCFAKRNIRRFVFAAFVLPPWSVLAQSPQDYPARPIRIVVPLTAGSAADVLARRLALKMNENWAQPVVVENRPGAGTTLGAGIVAKAAPDGYTLLINSAAFAASAAIYARLPYDPIKDFAPVSQLAIAPIVVVAAPSLGAKSIKDLVELAKQKPGQINFGSAGVGSSTHFAGEQFKLAAGLNAVHVPYKGPSEALLDVTTGRIQYSLSPLVPVLPFIRDGKLLALGVTTAQRSLVLPDVPTIAEAGLSDYEYEDWWGAFAPNQTPSEIVDKINKEIARILELPDISSAMARPVTFSNGHLVTAGMAVECQQATCRSLSRGLQRNRRRYCGLNSLTSGHQTFCSFSMNALVSAGVMFRIGTPRSA